MMNGGAFVVVFVSLIGVISCQTECAYPSDDIIRGRIGSILQSGETSSPTITLLETNTVCLAHSTQRDRYRMISLVVRYNCTGIASCPASPAEEQFEIVCDSTNNWGNTAFGSTSSTGLRTPMPAANLSTPLRDCAICFSPVSAAAVPGAPTPDETNHCAPCSAACNQNLMRCTDQSGDVCCNVYQGSTCAVDCSSNFVVEDSTGVCVCPPGTTGADCDEVVDCGTLTDPVNGEVSFTNTTYQSTATYTCDTFYYLMGETTRMCQGNGNWSEMPPTCTACTQNCDKCNEAGCNECTTGYKLEDKECNSDCSVPGCATCDSDPVNKCDVCESGRTLDSSQTNCITDEEDKEGGGDFPIGAIIGIVIGILVLLLLVAVLVAVVVIVLVKNKNYNKVG